MKTSYELDTGSLVCFFDLVDGEVDLTGVYANGIDIMEILDESTKDLIVEKCGIDGYQEVIERQYEAADRARDTAREDRLMGRSA